MDPPTAQRIIEHMNDDHYEALADYVRHFGRIHGDIYRATLRSITFEAMCISYRTSPSPPKDEDDGKTSEIVVPFEPHLSSSADTRPRLVGMAIEARIARIPRPQLPGPVIGFLIIFGLGFLGQVAYFPEDIPRRLVPLKKFTESIYLHSIPAMRATFVLSVIIHILEGFYAAYAMKRAAGSFAVLRHKRCVSWTIATMIFGFASLSLLTKGIAKLHNSKRKKSA